MSLWLTLPNRPFISKLYITPVQIFNETYARRGLLYVGLNDLPTVMIDIEGRLNLFSISLIGGAPIGARAILVIDMVWLYRSPFPVRREGVFYLLQLFLHADRGGYRKWGGGGKVDRIL